MKVYDCSEASLNLQALMDEAWTTGYVKIRQRAGRDFMLRPWELRSPLEELEAAIDSEPLLAEALTANDGILASSVKSHRKGKAA